MNGASMRNTYNYWAVYFDTFVSHPSLILVYPQRTKHLCSSLFFISDKWGVTEFPQWSAPLIILNHEFSLYRGHQSLWYRTGFCTPRIILKDGFTYVVYNRHLGLIALAYNGYRQLTALAYNGYWRRIYVTEHRLGLWYNITNAIEECEEYSITMYGSRGYDDRTYDRTERYYRSICLQSRLRSSKRLVRSMRLRNNRSKARMLEQRNYYAIRRKRTRYEILTYILRI